jgi:hypothetical protein
LPMADGRTSRRTMQRAPEPNGRSTASADRPLAEVLEHLLDPLESAPKSTPPHAGQHAAPSSPAMLFWPDIEEPRRLRDALRMFPHRLRQSQRLRYRILRLTLVAVPLVAGLFGLVWLMLAYTGQA